MITFVVIAVRGTVNFPRKQAEFLARGELAWDECQRTGQPRRAGKVFYWIHGRIDARRQERCTES